ncbi:competence protein ComEC [Orenia metallireducens]|uniref:Competence protein ComEC n=1 Tax=Orenia metallireducens TaxID=1413210 RepID=A0A285IAW8_9FIRM|nr:DNA internalization-related competence protein ComEC/Rec2 [Orenia metallireducens]PRX20607.1 competence protein ComEC [Orenia metallireducens]SNY45122.1 competence protein ComEC [Orenia metallireducens]
MLIKVRRPLVEIFILLVLGLIVASYLPIDFTYLNLLEGVVIILVLIASYLWKQKSSKVRAIVYFIIFLLGFVYLQSVELNWENDKLGAVIGDKVKLVAKVLKASDKGYSKEYLLTDIRITDRGIYSDKEILLSAYKIDPKLGYGDIIELDTRLELADAQHNPGGFSYRNYLKQQGIYGVAKVNSYEELRVVANRANFIMRSLFKLREEIKSLIQRYFYQPYNYILEALLLGDKSLLPDRIEDNFRRLGLSHLLVISGFHIGLLSYLLYLIGKRLNFSKRLNLIFNLIFLSSYLIITGCQLPSLRAVLLIFLVLLGNYLERRIDMYNLLAGVGIIILLINPFSLFTVSFQLSFGAVVAISFLTPVISSYLPIKNDKLNNLISGSLAAQLGLLPLLSYYFYEISLLSVLSNLLIMPLISLVLWIGVFFVLAALMRVVIIAKLLAIIIKVILCLVLKIVNLIADTFITTLLVGKPTILTIVLYYLIIYSLVKVLKPRLIPYSKNYKLHSKVIILTTILLLIIQLGFGDLNGLNIIFLSVGSADGIYLETPSHQKILIDGGKDGKEIREYLRSRGIRRLDMAFISHFHADHVGGIIELIKEFKVDRIFYPPILEEDELSREFFKLAEDKEIKVTKLCRGDNIRVSQVNFKVLAPSLPLVSESPANNNSLVLRLIYKNFKVLFTGDLEIEGEERLLASSANLSSTILKVGHHGSNTSSSIGFIDKINPALAVISVGKNNYGHPSREVVNRFKARGIKVLRTDYSGAVTLWTDGHSYRYEEFLLNQ